MFLPTKIDTHTSTGRSKERYRRALLTTVSSGLSKLITVTISLISVPLTFHYLGVERYGLWMTISSVIAFASFSDLGISNGLMNGISKAHGRDDRILAREYVSTALFFLTTIAFGVGTLFAVVYRWIPWNALFHVKSPQAIAESGPAVAAFVFCFLLATPASVVSRIQNGYQEGFAANLWSSGGSILAMLSILIVIKFNGSLVFLVLAMVGGPLLSTVVNGVVLFAYQRPWLRPALSQVRRGVASQLLSSGFLFFILQLTMSVGFLSDNIVVAQVLGPEAVTQYSIPARLFGQISLLGLMIGMPLWPAYTEALERRDHAWVRHTLKSSMRLLVLLSVVLGTTLVLAGPLIIKLWVGPTVEPKPLLVGALGAWGVISTSSIPLSMLLNAASVVRFQVIISGFAAVANIAISILLTRTMGISGVVFGSIISQSIIVLIPYAIYTYRFVRRLPLNTEHFADDHVLSGV